MKLIDKGTSTKNLAIKVGEGVKTRSIKFENFDENIFFSKMWLIIEQSTNILKTFLKKCYQE